MPAPNRLALLLLTAVALTIGCGDSDRGYPEVRVTSVLGTRQPCHQCGRFVDSVDATHLLDAGSARYVVCSDECRAKQEDWHVGQFGR
ncbi:MAG TPA: hypothetical protein PLI18_03845 [Pirellulaceae bacterium]|nr:hypothetical protein [Pirellulaceae bacterium]